MFLYKIDNTFRWCIEALQRCISHSTMNETYIQNHFFLNAQSNYTWSILGALKQKVVFFSDSRRFLVKCPSTAL